MYHVETVGNERTSTFPYAVVGPFGIINRHSHRANAEHQAAYYANSGRDPFGLRVRYLLRITKTTAYLMQRVDAAGWIGPNAEDGALDTLTQWERDIEDAHGAFATQRIHVIAQRSAIN